MNLVCTSKVTSTLYFTKKIPVSVAWKNQNKHCFVKSELINLKLIIISRKLLMLPLIMNYLKFLEKWILILERIFFLFLILKIIFIFGRINFLKDGLRIGITIVHIGTVKIKPSRVFLSFPY